MADLMADLAPDSPLREPDSPGVSASMFGAHDAPDGEATGDSRGADVEGNLEAAGIVGAGKAAGGASTVLDSEGPEPQGEQEEQDAREAMDAEMNAGARDGEPGHVRQASAVEDMDEDNESSAKRPQPVEEEDEEEYQEREAERPKKKKSRAVSPERSASPVEQRAPDAELGQAEQAERRRRELDLAIQAATRPTKKRPRKKKDDEVDLDQAADDEVAQIRDRMIAAANDDHTANDEKRPATNKLRMLGVVVDTLQKSHLQQSILDNNLLDGVRRWLEPLPDKSLPSLNIQRAFFPILLGMEIDTISLKMSGLGKVVLFYSMCGRVEAGIRRIADRLIENWSRPILKRSASYRDRQQQTKAMSYERPIAMEFIPETMNAASQSRRNAQPPPPVTGRDFLYAPVSQVAGSQDDSHRARAANHDRLNKFKRSLREKK